MGKHVVWGAVGRFVGRVGFESVLTINANQVFDSLSALAVEIPTAGTTDTERLLTSLRAIERYAAFLADAAAERSIALERASSASSS